MSKMNMRRLVLTSFLLSASVNPPAFAEMTIVTQHLEQVLPPQLGPLTNQQISTIPMCNSMQIEQCGPAWKRKDCAPLCRVDRTISYKTFIPSIALATISEPICPHGYLAVYAFNMGPEYVYSDHVYPRTVQEMQQLTSLNPANCWDAADLGCDSGMWPDSAYDGSWNSGNVNNKALMSHDYLHAGFYTISYPATEKNSGNQTTVGHIYDNHCWSRANENQTHDASHCTNQEPTFWWGNCMRRVQCIAGNISTGKQVPTSVICSLESSQWKPSR